MEPLPPTWEDIQPDIIYQTTNGLQVSFSQAQIQLAAKYDQNNKHLKAIEKKIVSPRGSIGLVSSEVESYDLKSKVLGKGGDRRFHAKLTDRILHFFPGFTSEH